MYFMEGTDDDSDEYFHNLAWEEQLNLLIGKEWTADKTTSGGSVSNGTVVWESEKVEVYPITAGAVDREFEANVNADITLLTIGIGRFAKRAFWRPHAGLTLLVRRRGA